MYFYFELYLFMNFFIVVIIIIFNQLFSTFEHLSHKIILYSFELAGTLFTELPRACYLH